MNIDFVEGNMKKYVSECVDSKQFSPSGLKNFMEDVFQKGGFREPKPYGTVPEILVVRNDAAGDFVIFSSFLRELRRIYKGAHITLLVSSRNKELAACCPYVDNIEVDDAMHSIDDTIAALKNAADVGARLLKYNFDVAFSSRIGLRSFHYITAYLSGATTCIGFDQDRPKLGTNEIHVTGWNNFLDVKVPLQIGNGMHDADRNLSILEHLIKCPIMNRDLEVWFTPAEAAEARNILAPMAKKKLTHLIAAVPSSSMPSKTWPIENYIELFKQILKTDKHIGLVIMGGPGDEAICEALYNAFKDRSINVGGKCNFRLSAAILNETNIYVGNDTGLQHIAAACHKPVLSTSCYPASLGLDGMSVPVRFAPYRVPNVVVLPPVPLDECRGHASYGCERQGETHCIKGITVELMWLGYQALIKRVAANDITPFYLTDKSKIPNS